jgi:hypothetical protein
MKSLSHFVQQIPDHRRAQGIRHPFHSMIAMIILSNLNGYFGLREMDRFFRHNAAFFTQTFNLKHGVPGFTILRTFCLQINFEDVNEAFCKWASQYIEEKSWFSIDGKGIKSTANEHFSAQQNFMSIVSLFGHKTGIVIRSAGFENKQKSEIHSVQELISQLDQKGMILTLDALHCQKKPSKPSWIKEMTM